MTQEPVPGWLEPVRAAAGEVDALALSRFVPPPDGSARPSAVLVLFGEGTDGPDLLLIERSHDLRSHAGQLAFPGGAADPTDSGPVETALREAQEETGLDPAGVTVLGALPALWLPPSNYSVTPVLAWWRTPSEVAVVDPGEVARVLRVRLGHLLDPANRYTVRHPSGYVGPAFAIDDLVLWGFTAGILDRLFAHLGWEREWDPGVTRPLPEHLVELATRTYDPRTDRP